MFLASYLQSSFRTAKDGLIKTVAGFDPDGVQEAQLMEYKKAVDEIATTAAKTDAQLQSETQRIASQKTDIQRHLKALEILQAQADAETDPIAKTKKMAAVETESSRIDTMMNTLESDQTNLAQVQGYANELHAAHKTAVEKWTKGRANLERAKTEQARARLELDRAQERKADTERVAGLVGGLTGVDAGMNAMTANTKTMREKAAALNMTSTALNTSTGEDADIAAALAAADAPISVPVNVSSLKDRFAALNK